MHRTYLVAKLSKHISFIGRGQIFVKFSQYQYCHNHLIVVHARYVSRYRRDENNAWYCLLLFQIFRKKNFPTEKSKNQVRFSDRYQVFTLDQEIEFPDRVENWILYHIRTGYLKILEKNLKISFLDLDFPPT